MLFSASKWPIEKHSFHAFSITDKNWQIFGTEFFIPKGVNYAKIKKTETEESRVYHIFNTHLQVNLVNDYLANSY